MRLKNTRKLPSVSNEEIISYITTVQLSKHIHCLLIFP